MLAYNFSKHNSRTDPVREILAKLDAKQSKTGFSLYNQDDSTHSPCLTPVNMTEYSSLLQDNMQGSLFPDLKTAREKAQTRITADLTHQGGDFKTEHTKTMRVPHRLPGTKVDNQFLPPLSVCHATRKMEERMNQSNQFDKEKLDINVNPFGYNRKTLAFDNRDINYVVEWPETWPFKITSFQRKSKQIKKKQKRIHHPGNVTCSSIPNPTDEQPKKFHWEEHTSLKKRVLAPVDHPSKPPVLPSRPFFESAIKRVARRVPSKEEPKPLVLRSRGKDLEFASKKDEALKKENQIGLSSSKQVKIELRSADYHSLEDSIISIDKTVPTLSDAGKIKMEESNERVDSVPPSTPVPEDLQTGHTKETEEQQRKEAKAVLQDIVNQIISEDKPKII